MICIHIYASELHVLCLFHIGLLHCTVVMYMSYILKQMHHSLQYFLKKQKQISTNNSTYFESVVHFQSFLESTCPLHLCAWFYNGYAVLYVHTHYRKLVSTYI